MMLFKGSKNRDWGGCGGWSCRMFQRYLKVFALCLELCACLFLLACHDSSYFGGAYEENENSGRLLSQVPSTRRYHRLRMRQFDTTVGGIVEYFDVGSFEEFQAQPEYVTSALQYHHCYRLDSGYVRSDTLYVTYTDLFQQRWQLRLEHDASHGSMIYGSLSRLSYNDRVIDQVSSEDDMPFLEEDKAWFEDSDLKALFPQIAMSEIRENGKQDLSCMNYYRDHTFYVSLPEEIADGRMCVPSAKRCDNLRLGVLLTRLDGDAVLTDEYMTARLDAYDIDPEQSRRKLRFRELPNLYANSLGNVAFATIIIYEDRDNSGHWTASEDPILAGLRDEVLVFAPEKSHEMIRHITGKAARFDEMMVQEAMSPWVWKAYEVLVDKKHVEDERISRISGLGSVRELPLTPELTLDVMGRGCVLAQDAFLVNRPCAGLLPIGEMP